METGHGGIAGYLKRTTLRDKAELMLFVLLLLWFSSAMLNEFPRLVRDLSIDQPGGYDPTANFLGIFSVTFFPTLLVLLDLWWRDRKRRRNNPH